mmetsp:Transcript_2983/g.8139  ORF Transcript_2983/g.8139 Transcript_2983/m.8139 type:complete len:883 (-) Transcript_2983:1081-3729(-)|eukprot:CAMPEP_0197180216 /NCGR_PEP_ID=MMETSP1423-20130617/4894_1 /TAXON_ID=476441 /ORGANISM="Pseudo-nitzschia heimii, Strain UNC1101" /LENGTH=882 /DNA_ID=CAMNT_0042630251 /DNA_START=208 /DNA_END=2856 /DNA_ORIENTATION=+
MKSFDEYLQRAQVPQWKLQYIDYVSLKESLKQFGKRRRKLQRGDLDWSTVLAPLDTDKKKDDSIETDEDNNIVFGYSLQNIAHDAEVVAFGSETNEDRLSKLEHDDFKKILEDQLNLASRWFQARWLELQSTSFRDEKEEEEKIMELYGYAVVNICVLRQLILKYNAHVRMYDGSMYLSEWEILNQQSSLTSLSSSLMVSTDIGEQLQYPIPEGFDDSPGLEDESIDCSVKTLLPSLISLLEPLQDRMMTMPSYWMMSDSSEIRHIVETEGDIPNSNFRARANELESILDKTAWKQQVRQSPNKTERLMQTIRSLFTMGTKQMGISMEPKFLYMQVRGFKKEMKALAVWREQPMGVGFGDDEKAGGGAASGGMDPANVWPLVLNLVSCYLFMMNNYIIEPSSAYYANALGSSDALSGIMMGMAPWFALTSAVGYSIWTNTSYKQPLLFAGTLMVIGNTLYGAAYSYQSMTMCLVGRAISGFGAPRIINRRYVADATPFRLRTMSSAAFALTTALGAASGPGFAILLDMITEFQFPLPYLGIQTFNGMTGPGFVMAFLWLIFTITILVSFGEPNRSGIDELKQREAAAKKVAASKKTSGSEKDDALLAPSTEHFGDEDVVSMGATTDDDDDDDDHLSVGDMSVSFYDRRKDDNQKDRDETDGVSKHSPLYCIKNMTRATALCMALIFMKRIALESIVGSTSVITKNRYAWSIRNVGTLHLMNGLIVIPVSIFAGWLSQYREDRYLAMWFMGITAVGLLVMVDPTDLTDVESSQTYNEGVAFAVGPAQYVVGSLIAFSGVEACESFVASLMSKCVPSTLAVGTFNSGLLATLVGTGGRATGDLFITVMGLISIRNLLNLLIVPGLALMLLSMFLLWKNYKIVAV